MSFVRTTYRILSDPAGFFESIREEGWLPPYFYLLAVALTMPYWRRWPGPWG